MTTLPSPSRQWRVESDGVSADYRSPGAAYEAARSAARTGARVRVLHWEHGSWVPDAEVGGPDDRAVG